MRTEYFSKPPHMFIIGKIINNIDYKHHYIKSVVEISYKNESRILNFVWEFVNGDCTYRCEYEPYDKRVGLHYDNQELYRIAIDEDTFDEISYLGEGDIGNINITTGKDEATISPLFEVRILEQSWVICDDTPIQKHLSNT